MRAPSAGRSASSAIVLACVLLTQACGGPAFDVLIRGGEVVDGTGAPARAADVGIRGDSIVAVGDLSGQSATRVIDAAGLTVAPGFIDMHSHSDFALLVDGRALSKVTQGVTTELLGESGSAAPALGPARAERERGLAEQELALDWTTLGEYFQRLERQGMSVNILSTVASGQVRAAVVGYDNRPATAEELRAMEELVDQAMRDGAVGLSSGLIYPPNSYASTEELIALARVAARHGGFYLTHMRNEGNGLLGALEETIRIGREGGLPVEVLHFKRSGARDSGRSLSPTIQEAAALIEKAQSEGLAVYADVYPYAASQTGLDQRIPDWAHDGGREAMVARLRDPATRARIRKEITASFASNGSAGESIQFGGTPYEPHRRLQGKRISEIAREMGLDPAETIIELVDKAEGSARAIYHSMREEDVRYALSRPWTTIGSDGTAVAPEGILARSHPHPRWYGTFARVLGHYVRQERLLSLEEAVRKMTSLAASRLGLTDRGTVAPGYKADLAVFDPETIIDRSTFEDPHQLSEGVQYLIVNGTLVLDGGQHTGAMPGRVLRNRSHALVNEGNGRP